MAPAPTESDVAARLEALLPRLHRFALALTANPEDAADLTQSTCARILAKQEQWQNDVSFEGWAFRITRTVWLNEMRRQRIRKNENFASRDIDDLVATLPSLEERLTHREIVEAVMQLPSAHREVVLLCLVEGQTYAEAALVLEVPDGTVMSRLARARSSLKKRLRAHTTAALSQRQ